MRRLPQRSTLFPYTTLFRSRSAASISPPRRVKPETSAKRTVAHRLSKRGAAGLRGREGASLSGVATDAASVRSEEHTSELQSHSDLVCRLLLEKKNKYNRYL